MDQHETVPAGKEGGKATREASWLAASRLCAELKQTHSLSALNCRPRQLQTLLLEPHIELGTWQLVSDQFVLDLAVCLNLAVSLGRSEVSEVTTTRHVPNKTFYRSIRNLPGADTATTPEDILAMKPEAKPFEN